MSVSVPGSQTGLLRAEELPLAEPLELLKLDDELEALLELCDEDDCEELLSLDDDWEELLCDELLCEELLCEDD